MPTAHPTDGALDFATDRVTAPCEGFSSMGIRLSGTFDGEVTFQGSVDGAQYDTLTVQLFDNATTATTATAPGQWRVSCAGLAGVRCEMTTFVSGLCHVSMLATEP